MTSWTWWFSSRNGYSTYLGPSSTGGCIYFSIATFIEVVVSPVMSSLACCSSTLFQAQVLSFYRLDCRQIEDPPVDSDTNFPRSNPIFGPQKRPRAPPIVQPYQTFMPPSSKPGVAPVDSSSPPEKLFGEDWEPEELFTGLFNYFQRRNLPPENLTGLEELFAKTTLEEKTNKHEPKPRKSFWVSFFGDIRSTMLYICRIIIVDFGKIILFLLVILGRIIYSILVYIISTIVFTPVKLGNKVLSWLVSLGRYMFATVLKYGISIRGVLARHFKKWWRTYATVVPLMAVGHLVSKFWRFGFAIYYDKVKTTLSISMSPVSAIVSSVKARINAAMSWDV